MTPNPVTLKAALVAWIWKNWDFFVAWHARIGSKAVGMLGVMYHVIAVLMFVNGLPFVEDALALMWLGNFWQSVLVRWNIVPTPTVEELDQID